MTEFEVTYIVASALCGIIYGVGRLVGRRQGRREAENEMGRLCLKQEQELKDLRLYFKETATFFKMVDGVAEKAKEQNGNPPQS